MTNFKKNKASKTELEAAESMYCERGMSTADIAERLNRDPKTIMRWRDEYGWEETRDMFTASPLVLKRKLLKAANQLADGQESLVRADDLSKVMKAYDYMCQSIGIPVIIDVLKQLDEYVSKNHPQEAITALKWHKEFLLFKTSQEL